MIKKIRFILTLLSLSISVLAIAQKSKNDVGFEGAAATLKSYKALYIVNQADDKKIRGVIKNVNNALNDPRLKGKLQVELLAFGDGTEIFKKSNHYDTLLTQLQSKGVILAQCENTVRERHINKEDLWPFISYVPSASGEIIIRQYQGWAIVQP